MTQPLSVTALPRRRTILTAAGALVLTGTLGGCGLDWENLRLEGGLRSPPTPAADEVLRRRAVDVIQSLTATTAALRISPAEPSTTVAKVLLRTEAAHRESLHELGAPPPDSPPAPAATAAAATPADLVARQQAGAAALLSALDGANGPTVRLVAAVVGGLLVGVRDLAVAAGVPRPAVPQARPGGIPGVDDPGLGTWLYPPTAPPGLPSVAVGSAAPTEHSLFRGEADEAATTALARCIQREHTAEYGYPLVAVSLSGQARADALAQTAVHRTAAANLDQVAESVGGPPSPAELAYPVDPAPDPAAARAAALDLELDCAEAFSVLVAGLDAPQATARAVFVDAMLTRVLAARGYGLVPAIPGLAEHR